MNTERILSKKLSYIISLSTTEENKLSFYYEFCEELRRMQVYCRNTEEIQSIRDILRLLTLTYTEKSCAREGEINAYLGEQKKKVDEFFARGSDKFIIERFYKEDSKRKQKSVLVIIQYILFCLPILMYSFFCVGKFLNNLSIDDLLILLELGVFFSFLRIFLDLFLLIRTSNGKKKGDFLIWWCFLSIRLVSGIGVCCSLFFPDLGIITILNSLFLPADINRITLLIFSSLVSLIILICELIVPTRLREQDRYDRNFAYIKIGLNALSLSSMVLSKFLSNYWTFIILLVLYVSILLLTKLLIPVEKKRKIIGNVFFNKEDSEVSCLERDKPLDLYSSDGQEHSITSDLEC